MGQASNLLESLQLSYSQILALWLVPLSQEQCQAGVAVHNLHEELRQLGSFISLITRIPHGDSQFERSELLLSFRHPSQVNEYVLRTALSKAEQYEY
jgi:hypothetical protein